MNLLELNALVNSGVQRTPPQPLSVHDPQLLVAWVLVGWMLVAMVPSLALNEALHL